MDNETVIYHISEADLDRLINQLENIRANLILPRKLNQSIASAISAVNDCLQRLSSIRSNQPRETV